MRIAIVGKGGSGKSSISWLFACHAARSGLPTLAIDADYNMDLAHNLGIEPSSPFLKGAEKDIYHHFGIDLSQNAFDILALHKKESFTFDDTFMNTYAKKVSDNLQLMVLGDHDEETMYSGRCSHAYAKSIKFYLPYLHLRSDEMVIIDSVAGTDMLNYGLYLGVDAIICVVEQTKNSIAVMESTKRIADAYGIPFFVVLNKCVDITNVNMSVDPIGAFLFDPAFATYEYENVMEKNKSMCDAVLSHIQKHIPHTSTIHRLEEWKRKHDLGVQS